MTLLSKLLPWQFHWVTGILKRWFPETHRRCRVERQTGPGMYQVKMFWQRW
jgi:hypothetical protein